MNDASGQPAPAATAGEARRRNPWWIPPFLGRVPEMPPETVRLLGVISLALLFENFDQATLTAALKQIAVTYAVPEADLGRTLGFVHLGALPAFLLVPFADRIGRRRLFLISVIGISAASFASAFAPSIAWFVALQMISRVFMVTCSATAFVIITEEFPAEHRGWGIGIVSAVGAFGVALALILFAAIDLLPFGWRSMYALGILPLLLLPMFRREVRETRRFAQHRDERAAEGQALSSLAGWWRPMWSLLRAYPGRAAGIGLIGAFAAAGHSSVYNFSSYYVQSVHGWSPGNYTVMVMASGLVGIIGFPFAGRLADRTGRRRAGFALFAAFPLLSLAFYQGSGWLLPLMWMPIIFALTGGATIARALGGELFPTSYRGTSAGWLQLAESAGRSGGLFLVGAGTARAIDLTSMISGVAFATLLAGLVLLALPETGRRELEEISADR
ncbi:MAG TPA: MFS transporter [Myxococcota bacterium]